MVRKVMHPADELAEVRNDIERLKRREAFLQKGFLNDSLPRLGHDTIANVRPLQKRTFLKDKLPAHILNDESYWRIDLVRHVMVAPAPGSAGGLLR